MGVWRCGTVWVAGPVAVALIVPAPVASADGQPVRYPAYHRVRQGESMWSIAREFLVRATGHEPTNLVTSHEVRQMRRLNRDALHGSDRIYPGQRLLLAPTTWDVPDGKDGWGTGFTLCINEQPPQHATAASNGVILSVRLLKPPVDRRMEPVRLGVHNRSTRQQQVDVGFDHALLVPDSGLTTAHVQSDAQGVAEWTLQPGQTRHFDGQVAGFVCGDTRYLDQRLPSGRYRMVGIASVGRHGHPRHESVTVPREVRVVRD